MSSVYGDSVKFRCDRLGLKMLAYLWHQDQTKLMRSMIGDGVEAIIIKVAAMGKATDSVCHFMYLKSAFVSGLDPKAHLGKTLQEILPQLLSLVRPTNHITLPLPNVVSPF